MKFKTRNHTKLSHVTLTVVILCVLLIKCQSAHEYQRPKRTVGFLFRSFIDAFKTQRQPEPMVHSYQPLKQTKQASTSQSTLQSTKDELLASSRNIVEQKKNLFKPPSTRASEMHLFNQIFRTNPALNTLAKHQLPSELCNQDSHKAFPSLDTNSIPSQFNAHQHTSQNFNNAPLDADAHQKNVTNQSQNFHKSDSFSLSPVAKLNPVTQPAPQSNHYSPMPFKAHIFVLPFQGNNAELTPFSGYNREPSTPVVPLPINYQAEIYLQPTTTSTTVNHDAARFSESSGWRDVDEIIARVNKKLSIKNGETKDAENAKILNTPYSVETPPEENYSRDMDTSNPYEIESTHGEISSGQKRLNQTLDCCKDFKHPLFIPQAQYNPLYNLQSYPNQRVEVERRIHFDPTFAQNEYYENAAEQIYHARHFDDYQYQVVHHNLNSDVLNGQYNISNLPRDNDISKTNGEVVRFGKNFLENYHIPYEDTKSDVQNVNVEKVSFGNIHHHPTKIGRLPDFLANY